MDVEDIFAAFTHLSPGREAYEVHEGASLPFSSASAKLLPKAWLTTRPVPLATEEDTMPTLNSPVHPVPVAQTPGNFVRQNFPDVVHRYMRFWHTVLCGKHEIDFMHWFEPEVKLLARGSGRTGALFASQ